MKTRQEKNWLERNWKWLLPVSLLTVAILFAGVIFAFVFFIMGVMKSSDAFAMAMNTARTNRELVAVLGSPIEEGWYVGGNVSTSGGSGKADLSIPISGPKGKATLYVRASKTAGQWRFDQLVAEIDGSGQRIKLVDDQALGSDLSVKEKDD